MHFDAPTAAELVKAGAHVDQPSHAQGTSKVPALVQAAGLGATTADEDRAKLAILTMMLAQKPNLETRDPFGQTALIAAAVSEDPDAVNLLLKAGATTPISMQYESHFRAYRS